MNINGMKILSVDEDANNLAIIENYAQSLSLEAESFEDPQEALISSEQTAYDLVIVDYGMSVLNGLEFIKAFRHKNSDVPIIMLTEVEEDVRIQEKALRLGAHEVLSKPVNAVLFQARVFNALKLAKAQSLLKDQTLLLEDEVKNATRRFKESEQEALQFLGLSAQYKEYKAGAHTQRIAHYSKVLAKAAGLSEKIQEIVFYASQFYDLGKVGIADEILLKPGKLDEEEFEVMKRHARIGYDILKYSQSGYLKAGAVIAYSHHEKYDGSGYPIGLIGETIPIPGRIVAIADVFDALTQARVYKEAWSIEDACALLIQEKGKHFDPKLVDLFMQNLDAIKAIKNKFSDEV